MFGTILGNNWNDKKVQNRHRPLPCNMGSSEDNTQTPILDLCPCPAINYVSMTLYSLRAPVPEIARLYVCLILVPLI